MAGFASSFSTIWRLVIPYFRSDDRRRAWVLLVAVIAMELGVVCVTVLLNRWYNGFYNALQDRNWEIFVIQAGYFCGIAISATLLNAYKVYLNQWLEIRWRRWLTKIYLRRWLHSATHYRMQLTQPTTDNPDQRIAEDIKLFIEQTLTIGLGLLNSIVSFGSFTAILWGLSEGAPLHLAGTTFAIPGYLVWAAIVYAVAGTAISHWIGKPLAPLNFAQQRYEADFRFNLVRIRENSEQIALLGGETVETDRLNARFDSVVTNWHRIMSRQKRLAFFTAGYSQAAIIFPFIVLSPAYFSGAMQLGGLVQTAAAFGAVQVALSFFVNIYPTFAQWLAVIARLNGFEQSVEAASAVTAAAAPSRVDVVWHPATSELAVTGLAVQLPAGTPLIAAEDLVIKTGERTLITGPSGSGKSTFFRAVAGIWPFGTGTVTVPRGAKCMVLPQRPYFFLGSLEEAVAYPSDRGTFELAYIAEVLTAVRLPALAVRLSDEAHWNQILSLGEQQRLSIARAILHAPDYLFLDEATSSLDESSEAMLYSTLLQYLPNVTIISIGHRSTLAAFHNRRLMVHPEFDGHRIRDTESENTDKQSMEPHDQR